MKYEIEIPKLPEGVKPVGYRWVSDDEFFIEDGLIKKMIIGPSFHPELVVEPADGFEFFAEPHKWIVRRLPRKKVLIELEWSEAMQKCIDRQELCLASGATHWGITIPPSAVRVVEE